MARRSSEDRRAAGELETDVLAALWTADQAMTPAEVQQQVDTELAYTTVVTILTRLHDKGAVVREKRGRSFAYTPVDDEAGLTAKRMRSLLDTGPDRRRVLARFVSKLSAPDEQTLRTLLRDPGQG